ncbi:DgyrCDS3920 [Dimorphilus gyrociliatus]|uniref:DgyrCDS3920 n=1 Tax=Dimorphilus gyrociliatus TaxID=2664684 RepID=A0A7I8VFC0_9ANNE|nr:DgyrCDS3920 [Dimorphilus gyrociliatus]
MSRKVPSAPPPTYEEAIGNSLLITTSEKLYNDLPSYKDACPEQKKENCCRQNIENKEKEIQRSKSLKDLKRKKRKVKIINAAFWTGWILCFPLFICLYCARESPTEDENLNREWCLPCYYTGGLEEEEA